MKPGPPAEEVSVEKGKPVVRRGRKARGLFRDGPAADHQDTPVGASRGLGHGGLRLALRNSTEAHARPRWRAVLGALALALVAVPAAQAACTASSTTKAFAAFDDNSDYSLAPAGSFESGATGWSLTSAWVGYGNESFRVGGAADSKSLSVKSYGQAVSPAFCVGVEHPSFRFFARRVSGYGGALHVSVRWTDDGISKEKTLGSVSGAVSQWAPSVVVLAGAVDRHLRRQDGRTLSSSLTRPTAAAVGRSTTSTSIPTPAADVARGWSGARPDHPRLFRFRAEQPITGLP